MDKPNLSPEARAFAEELVERGCAFDGPAIIVKKGDKETVAFIHATPKAVRQELIAFLESKLIPKVREVREATEIEMTAEEFAKFIRAFRGDKPSEPK